MVSKVKKKVVTNATKPSTKKKSQSKKKVSVEPADLALNEILLMIKETTQIDLSQYKESTIRRRIERQMIKNKHKDLKRYAQFLRTKPESLLELYNDIFIHVTEFFRDTEAFDALKSKVIPSLIKGKKSGDTIRVWVPGCSTGEEAYSILMLLTEFLESKKLDLRPHVFATDICLDSIQRARKGEYKGEHLKKLGTKRIKNFFDKTKDGYKIKKTLRDKCVFSQHDLISSPPFSNIDLISCRNVLIYFDSNLQKRILPIFVFSLRPGGYLFLGTSESVGNLSKHFTVVDVKNKIYSKNAKVSLPLNQKKFGTFGLEIKLFSEESSETEKGKKTSKKIQTRGSADKYVKELEKELLAEREKLRSLIEQFESTKEELMSSNEELHASIQELQGSNEELESAEEELQCTNEELMTANEELEIRNAELNKMNEQLIISEQRFRLIVESVKDYAIFMLDPDGYVASWNEGAKRFKGYEAQEIIGKHFSAFYSAEDKARQKPHWVLERAIHDGRVEDEGWRIRKDGTRFWASVVISRMNDPQGNLLGFSKVTRDLTEKRNAEEALRKSEERFRFMVNAVKDYAIIMLDTNGVIVSWNEGAKRIKGYEANEIIGQHFSRFYLPEDIARNHPAHELEIALRDGKFEEESWRLKKDGSKFWANVVITSLVDSDGKHFGYVKVTRDLTERKLSEEKLKNANLSLEQRVQERTKDLELALKSRDEFLSIASHELKTPLTSLKIQLQMSRRKLSASNPSSLPSPEEIIKSLDIGVKQVDSLNYLVEDLLDLSRIQTGVFNLSLQEFDLSELVEEIIHRYTQQLVASGCNVELKLESGVTGHWDRYRIEQVIVNIIFNAIKYAPRKPINIYTSLIDNNYARLIIEDFGLGIPKEQHQKIFERFERVNPDRNISGLGLGLFITSRIVEAHHGKIYLESEPNKGAKFFVELPLKFS